MYQCWTMRSSSMLGFSIMPTKNFQISNLGLVKEEEPEIKFQHSLNHRENKGFQKNIYLCFIDHIKAFDCVVITNCGKLSKRWGYQTILPVPWETCMWVKKQQLEPCKKQLIGSGLRKEYDRAVCCHPVYLTYKLSTSWEMLGWMSYKLESRLAEEESTTSDMQMIPF